MPTFSQNPHIDHWPVGASLQPNNEFVNGSTSGFSAVTGTNCTAVLSSNIAERAPYTVSLGSGQMVTTITAAAAAASKLGGTGHPTFVSGDRIFAEIWVKILGTTGTVGALTINPNFTMYTSADAYLALSAGSTAVLSNGSGWTRAWSTINGSALIGQQATAARVGTEAQLNQALPYTAGPNAQTDDMAEALEMSYQGGGPVSIS